MAGSVPLWESRTVTVMLAAEVPLLVTLMETVAEVTGKEAPAVDNADQVWLTASVPGGGGVVWPQQQL